ncbi:MAG: efflux RND transporter periplasmic adaptor subunit, partial [Acutalibacter sp.]
PSTTPTPAPTPTPQVTPTPEPSPTVPPASVTLYSRLDADSKPYSGSGTTEDPYVFLCTEDCTMTREFLLRLLGDGSGATPSPEDVLASPFAAIFEVREGNSNYGDLLYSFTLDGNALSGGFQVSQLISSEETLETVAETFQATTSKATPTPKPNSNNYNDMGYTRDELNDLIQQKRQEIKDLQLKVKQAKLDLDKSKLTLENSTVRSTVDGVVRTLTDVDTATQNGQPFLVVSGQGQYTVRSTISESLLTSIHIGDMVSAMSYDTGMTYSATITEISDYPLDGSYGGSGNPNDSTYEFTAVLDNSEGLSDGMYLEITLNVNQNSTDAIYLYAAYIREDEGGRYVMKAGIDNRLYKQYVQLGKSIYSGQYFEVLDGVTMEDYIAFPYGNDVKEGVRVVVEGTDEPPMPEDNGSGSSVEGTDSSLDSVPEDGMNDAVAEYDDGTAVAYF